LFFFDLSEFFEKKRCDLYSLYSYSEKTFLKCSENFGSVVFEKIIILCYNEIWFMVGYLKHKNTQVTLVCNSVDNEKGGAKNAKKYTD